MAEERLIDDDKDRKYKIRKNADGEDELYIDTSKTEAEDEEELGLEIPEFEEDDEEAAVMTPEQLAARKAEREEEDKRRAEQYALHVAEAEKLLADGDFGGALANIAKAEDLSPLDGAALSIKLKALSGNFTDFALSEELAEVADEFKEKASPEQKAELAGSSERLLQLAANLEEEIAVLDKENEEKKTERRGVFISRRKNALIFTACAVVPFIVFLALAIYFFTVRYALENGTNVVLTIVFACLAAVCFIVSLVAAHRLWDSVRNVRLNEKNSSTKLGRELESKKTKLKELTRIYAAFNEV